jgi:membrane protein
MPEVPSALPGWLRPRAAAVLATWFGRTLLRCVAGLLHVQIFDRAMTLAAQAFTSIFPLLIMFGTLLSAKQTSEFADLLNLPATSKRLFSEALSDQGVGSFGLISALVVLFSATGLARAMVRAYAIIWDVGKVRSGPAAAGRWLLTVLLLSAFVIIGKLTAAVTAYLPLPGISRTVIMLGVDCGLTVLIPMLLLGGAVPARRLIPGGLVFALVMLAVRPAGAIYLPRALSSSDAHYGTIGLAFTYISWLYVLSFCLLGAAVIGKVLADDEGLLGRVIRGEAGLRPLLMAIRSGQLPPVHGRRVDHHDAERDGNHRPDRIYVGVREIDHQRDAGQHDGEHPAPDLAQHEGPTDHHEHDAEDQVEPAERVQAQREDQVGPGPFEALRTEQGERADRDVRSAEQEQH